MEEPKSSKKEEPTESAHLLGHSVHKEIDNVLESMTNFYKAMILLKEKPKDTILLYVVLFLISYVWAVVLSAIMFYFNDIWDRSDFNAGYIIGLYGLMTAITSLITGTFPQRFGLKYSISIGALCFAVGFTIIAVSDSFALSVVMVYTLLATGNSLCMPLVGYAINLYTPLEARIVVNCLKSIVMCGCFIFLGITISVFWEIFNDDAQYAYMGIFLSGAFAGLLASILIHLVGESRFINTSENEQGRHLAYSEIFAEKRFWRFITFLLFVTVIFGVFNVFWLSLGQYMTRELGEDVDWGFIFTIVSAITIIAIIAFTPFLFMISSYTLTITGLFIGSIAFYAFTMDSSYSMCCLFAVVFAVGQSFYSPRFYDYILRIAPPGQDGFYYAFLVLPNNLSLFMAGLLSGILLETYCPEDGERECWKMWMITTAIAVPTTIILILSKSWTKQPAHEEQPYMPCSKKYKSK